MLDTKLREQLLSLGENVTALVEDARARLGLLETHLDVAIRPVIPFSRMVGEAVTVRLAEHDADDADLSLLAKALEYPGAGAAAILVVEVPESLHAFGVFGEQAGVIARKNGYVGALIEGPVRDTAWIRDARFPTFSRTIGPGFMYGKFSAVSLNEPVTVGGRTIRIGDVIVGDHDGLCVTHPAEVPGIIEKAHEIRAWEERWIRAIESGKSYAQSMEIAGPVP